MTLGEEAVGDAIREGLAEPAGIGAAGKHDRHGRGAGVVGLHPAGDRVHQLALDHRLVAGVDLRELELDRLPAWPQDLGDSLLDPLPPQAGRHATVDPHLRPRGNHIDLVRGVDHRRRHGHAQQGLDQRSQRGATVGYPGNGAGRIAGILAQAL